MTRGRSKRMILTIWTCPHCGHESQQWRQPESFGKVLATYCGHCRKVYKVGLEKETDHKEERLPPGPTKPIETLSELKRRLRDVDTANGVLVLTDVEASQAVRVIEAVQEEWISMSKHTVNAMHRNCL